MSTEQYTVGCDFSPEASDQVALFEGSTVSVLLKRELGWWLVATEDGSQGWVPATHLQADHDEQEDQVVRYPKGMEEKFLVVKYYRSDLEDELSLEMGSVVEVVEKTMDGWWLVRCKGREGRVPATNIRRANTAKAQQMLEIGSQVTLESRMKEAKGTSKSPPKLSGRKSKKKHKAEPHLSQQSHKALQADRKSKTLPDVVPSQTDPHEEVLPPPPRREHSKKKKRQGAQKRRTQNSTRESELISHENPLQQEEYRSLQMLESVISLSEADNTNNNASFGDDADTTHDDLPLQRFAKNPNRAAARSKPHIKPKPTIAPPLQEQDTPTTPNQSDHGELSQRHSDKTNEPLTSARKEGRPIYVARASYRACDDTEVDLIADELVVVLEKSGEGWWYVQAKSGSGWAPNHFLKVPTTLMDDNPQLAEEKQQQHLEQLRPHFAKSTCSAAHQQDQHAPKHTVRHVVRGRPTLFREGVPATLPTPTKQDFTDDDSDIAKSVSDLRRMFNKM